MGGLRRCAGSIASTSRSAHAAGFWSECLGLVGATVVACVVGVEPSALVLKIADELLGDVCPRLPRVVFFLIAHPAVLLARAAEARLAPHLAQPAVAEELEELGAAPSGSPCAQGRR